MKAYGTELFSKIDVKRLRILRDLINRRCGQPGNRHLMPGLAARALRIIFECYAAFCPTLACMKLAEVHDLYLPKETVRPLMTRAGLWISRKLRPPRVHLPRLRRACTGELINVLVY